MSDPEFTVEELEAVLRRGHTEACLSSTVATFCVCGYSAAESKLRAIRAARAALAPTPDGDVGGQDDG